METQALRNQQLSETLKDELKTFDVVSLAKRENVIDNLMKYVAEGKEVTPILNTIFQAGLASNFSKFRKIANEAEKSALAEINDTNESNKDS